MAAFSYEYRTPGLYKTPADVAGAICQQLSDSEAGLSPATLLEASRADDAPLHGEFEWRDDVAAEKYRLSQAQGIIRNLRIVITRVDGTEQKERSFVVTPDRNSTYVPLQSALTNEVWRSHLLQQAREDMELFQKKYGRLTELADVLWAIGNHLTSKD